MKHKIKTVAVLTCVVTICCLIAGCNGSSTESPGTISAFVNAFNRSASKSDVGVAKISVGSLDSKIIRGDGFSIAFNTDANSECTKDSIIENAMIAIDNESVHSLEYNTDLAVAFFYGIDQNFVNDEYRDAITTIIAEEPRDFVLIDGYIIKKTESLSSTGYFVMRASEEDKEAFN